MQVTVIGVARRKHDVKYITLITNAKDLLTTIGMWFRFFLAQLVMKVLSGLDNAFREKYYARFSLREKMLIGWINTLEEFDEQIGWSFRYLAHLTVLIDLFIDIINLWSALHHRWLSSYCSQIRCKITRNNRWSFIISRSLSRSPPPALPQW